MLESNAMRTVTRTSAALALGLLLSLAAGGLGGCGRSKETEAADRQQIKAFLDEYLPKLAKAYRTGDTEPLAPFAAAKERAAIEKRVVDLA